MKLSNGVLQYLSCYTHRIAISDNRILNVALCRVLLGNDKTETIKEEPKTWQEHKTINLHLCRMVYLDEKMW